MFAVLILKIKDNDSFFFKLKYLWLIILWGLVIANVIFFTKNTKENSSSDK
jgi:hypothetical protein